MKQIFYHLFYRTYWWNIKVIREKDLPVLSAFLFTSGIMGINLMSLVFAVLTFLFKNPRLFPSWGHIALMIIVLITNYFLFVRRKKYVNILSDSQLLTRIEKRKRDIIIIIYLIFTFVLFIFIINATQNLLID